MQIHVKRIYEPAAAGDGVRVLVDRLWPRGVTKAAARVDVWLKEAAPSAGLRTWFGHEAGKWEGFCERYWKELDEHPEVLDKLHFRGRVTLLFAAKDEAHNNAVALRGYLQRREK